MEALCQVVGRELTLMVRRVVGEIVFLQESLEILCENRMSKEMNDVRESDDSTVTGISGDLIDTANGTRYH